MQHVDCAAISRREAEVARGTASGRFRYVLAASGLVALLSAPIGVAAECAREPGLARLYTDGWGFDASNTRFQPSERSTLRAANVAGLKLKWAFALGKPGAPHSYPLVTEDTVFIGDHQGLLYALDKRDGCQRWIRNVDSDIRTAVVSGRATIRGEAQTLLLFGTDDGGIYAIVAKTGDVLWRVQADVHPHTRITGTPAVHDGRVYVGVSSKEAAYAAGPTYSCCTFRGSVVALDLATGERVWRSYTIDQPARVVDSHFLMIKERGPSGAPIWSAPTIDSRGGRLYYGTGENYSEPATDTSDAIVAIDLADGTRKWVHQFTQNDAWNAACDLPLLGVNCPDSDGPDLDFGAPPILTSLSNGMPLLVAGQKSGMVHAMKPETGEIVWQQRVGRGGKLGGVHWGMAVNEALGLVFVPVSDRETDEEHKSTAGRAGLYALSLADGSIRWSAAAENVCANKENCYPGLSAAVTATNDLVFAAGLDGQLRAYRAATGAVVWSVDTWRSFDAVNGASAEGGAIDVHGPLVAGDMLFVTSGYDVFFQHPGNAFLAFAAEDSR